jgi:hypothetical protein
VSNIPFDPPRPSSPAPDLTGDRDLEIWNAVMWAYHGGHITPAQGSVAMQIPTAQFPRSYTVWHRQMIGGDPQGPERQQQRR